MTPDYEHLELIPPPNPKPPSWRDVIRWLLRRGR